MAFAKFDLDGDGFLSWEEFSQIGLEERTAVRIFRYCDAVGGIFLKNPYKKFIQTYPFFF